MTTAVRSELAATSGNLLARLDQKTFDDHFNRRPFVIGHQLVDHPLLDLARLVRLAQALPESRVEYNAGDLPVSQDPSSTPRNGLSIADTIRRIEECKSWMVLKNIEQDPDYSDLLDSCLAEVRQYSDRVSPGMSAKAGFIFISSAGSVTPFHIDPENNFLLQIRGRKQVHMFSQSDRQVVSEESLEAFFAGAHRNLPFQESFNARGQAFELLPGDGLHFPVAAPHWVQNGPEVSVSLSITFQTKDSSDRQSLHRLNGQLRKRGLRPRNVGESATSDRLKLAAIHSLRAIKRWTGR